MIDILIFRVYIFFIILFIIGLLWVLVPAMYGLRLHPTTPDRIRKVLQRVNLQAKELLYGLDSRDERVLAIAAR
jgi:hypothetical protein